MHRIYVKAMALAIVCAFFVNDVAFGFSQDYCKLDRAVLAPPLASKPPCQIVVKPDGSLYVVTHSDIIEFWDKETLRSARAGETPGSAFRNRWAFVDVGILIGQMLQIICDSKIDIQYPKDILISLIKKHIRNRNGEAEILLEGYDIDGIEEVREDGKITGFSLPIIRNGVPKFRQIYNLQDDGNSDTCIPLSDGARVFVKAEEIKSAPTPDAQRMVAISTSEIPPTNPKKTPARKRHSRKFKIPKSGNPVYKPGSMAISEETEEMLEDLGIIEPGYPNNWRLDKMFGIFDGAPRAVKRLLIQRLIRPFRYNRGIQNSHKIVRDLSSLAAKDPGFNIERIVSLISYFDYIEREYYEELKDRRNNHYPDSYWGDSTGRFRRPYPEMTKALILLGRMVCLLSSVDRQLPSGASETIDGWKAKIRNYLDSKKIALFTDRPELLRVFEEYGNPYLFSPELDNYEFVEKYKIRRKSSAVRINEELEWEYREMKDDPDFLEAIKGKGGLKKEVYELVLKQFNELYAEFKDLWMINTLPESTGRANRGTENRSNKHGFIRSFPANCMNNILANIDYYSRIAMLSIESNYKLPNISPDGGTINLGAFRNPFLEPGNKTTGNSKSGSMPDLFPQPEPSEDTKEGAAKNLEPISISLGVKDNALLLSGPNMGGKTTTVRTILTAVLLTRMGFPLPAEYADISLFNNIYTVFPRPEQLQEGYGYFASLISQLSGLTKKARPGDLVILDEVPVGTDYYELVAVAVVIIEDLIKSGATVLVTGHLKKAFELLAQRTGQTPYMHTVMERDGRVRPDFKLKPGVAKHSYAVELMGQAGFAPQIQDLARKYYSVITEGKGIGDAPVLALGKPADEKDDSTESAKYDNRLLRGAVKTIYPPGNFALLDQGALFDHSEAQKRIISFVTGDMEESYSAFESLPAEGAEKVKDPSGKVSLEMRERKVSDEERLSVIKTFLSMGQDRLQKITAQLQQFRQWSTVDRWYRTSNYRLRDNLHKIQSVKEALQKLIEYMQPIRKNGLVEYMTKILEEDIRKLDRMYDSCKNRDEAGAGENDIKKFAMLWQTEWGNFGKWLTGDLIFFDMYCGISRSVLQNKLNEPEFSAEENIFELRDTKPVFIRNGVAQSFAINPKRPVMVITGPNSSGKTVLMYNSMINAILAHRGFFIPGSLKTSRFDNIFTFFGGRDETSKGESYFLNILKRYADITNSATSHSLVILDELHGTDYFELAAIQLAVLHYLHSKNCTVIFNTHVRDGLKMLADRVGLDLWKTDVTYDEENKKVKPHFTVSPDPDLEAKSYGLTIASAYLTDDQNARAQEIHSNLTQDSENGRAAGIGSRPKQATSPESERIHAVNYQYTAAIIQEKQVKDQSAPTMVVLGTNWIKGYEKDRYLQYDALNPLITSLRNSGTPFVVGKDEDLPALIEMEKERLGLPANTKIVMLASVNGQDNEISPALKGLIENKANTVVGVDGRQLTTDSYIRLMEMLTMALKLSIGIEPNLKNEYITVLPPNTAHPIYILIPHAQPMDYEQLKAIYEVQKNA